MELRDWAFKILTSDLLEDKLDTPLELTDFSPGSPLYIKEPVRSSSLQFKKYQRKDRLPSIYSLSELDKRAACLHRFAGHELLAVEIMAHALLAFPDAPKNFRRGLAHTLKEEQEHVRLYVKRLSEMGVSFGDLPLYKYFWSYVPHLDTPLKYVSMMSLTFEMANLDFAPYYGKAFASHGDDKSEALMKQIFKDELRHVSFGSKWFEKLKDPASSPWETWVSQLHPRLLPARAKGPLFDPSSRRDAGISEEWITKLHESHL
ncbi:MAG: DUF455 family protein [Candidatus Rhabdochlamydia sp.]